MIVKGPEPNALFASSTHTAEKSNLYSILIGLVLVVGSILFLFRKSLRDKLMRRPFLPPQAKQRNTAEKSTNTNLRTNDRNEKESLSLFFARKQTSHQNQNNLASIGSSAQHKVRHNASPSRCYDSDTDSSTDSCQSEPFEEVLPEEEIPFESMKMKR